VCRIEGEERGISDDEDMSCLGRGQGGVDNSVSQTQTSHNNRPRFGRISPEPGYTCLRGRKGLLLDGISISFTDPASTSLQDFINRGHKSIFSSL